MFEEEQEPETIKSNFIYNSNKCEYFKSSIRSLNEHRVISDLVDMNLTKISNQMSNSLNMLDISSSMDSGIDSRRNSNTSLSPINQLDSISIDLSLDSYLSTSTSLCSTTTTNTIFRRQSVTVMPFLFSFNQSMFGFKQSLFNSKFVSLVKDKLLLKKQMTISTTSCEINTISGDLNCKKTTILDDSSSSSQSTQTKSKIPTFFYNTGINSLRQILLRIYDVNYF